MESNYGRAKVEMSDRLDETDLIPSKIRAVETQHEADAAIKKQAGNPMSVQSPNQASTVDLESNRDHMYPDGLNLNENE